VNQLEARYRERSLWLDQCPGPLEPRAPLSGDVDADVAVVGAGFTGLWTAYYLKRLQTDLRVTVVEKEIAGFGASGRNGGWASAGIAGSPSVYEHRVGRDAVLRGIRATQEAVDEIGRVAGEEGIDCGYLKTGVLAIATSEPQRRRVEATVRAQHARGLGEEDVRLLTPAEADGYVHARGVRAASFTPHAARIDPARLARGLAEACERIGVTVYERSPALALERGLVRCPDGTLRAPTVLRATEAFTTLLPGERLTYLPLYSLMIATEPLSAEVWEDLGWRDGLLVDDRRHLFFYAQRTTDGRVAIGGRGAPYRLGESISETRERNADVRARLERTLAQTFPPTAAARITHHWGGPLGVPRDWSMSVTFDRVSGLGFAGGYSGHGVAAANISGRTLADLVLGRSTDLVTLPWVGHRSRSWEPEPLRYVASNALVRMLGSADRHEDETDRDAKRVRLIASVLPPG
jgi:glycine/D-amino acid oxidase-like deaminating enzyme